MTAKAPATNLEHAIKRYVAGEGAQRLAAEFGISEQRLSNELKARGLFRDKAARYALAAQRMSATLRAQTGLPDAEIARRYIAGESENALAREFGVARTVITCRLRMAGVERRGSTEANRMMMAKRTPEENARNVAAAHVATANREQTLEEKIRRAKTRQERQTHTSPNELRFAKMLGERGISDCIPQLAIGPYNTDIGAAPVAVEIFGGGWHAYGDHARLAETRIRYILDQGWNLVIIWIDERRRRFPVKAADYVAAFIEQARRDPTMRGQYRVIGSDGKAFTARELKINQLTFRPTSRRCAHAGAGN